MPPQAESVELRPDDPRVADQPGGRTERDAHADEPHQEHAYTDVAGQAPLLHIAAPRAPETIVKERRDVRPPGRAA